MKISVIPYDPQWPSLFREIQSELSSMLRDFKPAIEHFGSTAVPGLSAKPVIDVLVGLKSAAELDAAVQGILPNRHYLYFEAFNRSMPGRRLFVRLKNEVEPSGFEQILSDENRIPHKQINAARMAHVHIWEYASPDWVRHIAFREYLKVHDAVRAEYEKLKLELSAANWEHGMAYNDAKNDFIKKEEKKAIEWYRSNS